MEFFVRRLLPFIAAILLSACAANVVTDSAELRRAAVSPVAVVAAPDAAEVNLVSADSQSLMVAAAGGAPATGVRSSEALRVVRDAATRIAPAVREQMTRAVETSNPVWLVHPGSAASTVTITASEIGFEEAQYVYGGQALYLVVAVEWLEAGRTLVERRFVYRSSERPLSAWTEALTLAEVSAGATSLGDRIVEALFMAPDIAPAVGSACGLQWLAPSRLYRPQLGPRPTDWNRFILLDTRTPTLAWETFHAYARRAGAEALADNARDVRYDLRVWRALPAAPLLVYERQGLTATEHTLDMPLTANAKFYWSVRARFKVEDGNVRSTPWSRFRLPYAPVSRAALDDADEAGRVRDPCLLDYIPEANYYRFATPAS